MSFLVHKIQICNWMKDDNVLPVSQVKADGITLDLKSGNNSISFWEIDSLEELHDIALSIFTGRDELADFYVLAIPKNSLDGKIEIENNDYGETAYNKYRSRHYDLLNMDLSKLSILTEIMVEALKSDKNVFDFIYVDNREDLKNLILTGEMDLTKIKSRAKKDLKIA